jgi:hypothetical protein
LLESVGVRSASISVSSVAVRRCEEVLGSYAVEALKPALIASLKVFLEAWDTGFAVAAGVSCGLLLALMEADRLAGGESGLSMGGENGRSRNVKLSCFNPWISSGENVASRAESGGIAIIEVVLALRPFFQASGGRLSPPRLSLIGVDEPERLYTS